MTSVRGYIGRKTIAAFDHVVNLFTLTHKIFRLFYRPPKKGRVLLRRIIMEQIYFTAVQALPVIIPVALILGTMLLIMFAKISGQYDLGKTTVFLVVRELGPIVTATLVILRSATAVTIETSYMNVLHETEALELSGIDPIRFVCLPRMIGITSAVFFLFIVFDLISILGGYGLVLFFTQIPVTNFIAQIGKAITAADIFVGLVKATVFGITITVVSLHHGFSQKRQITQVPVATSKAAVECIIFCLIANVLISVLFYF
jgi:phospholipid/cholesterol/gamma-HCH transport system permease protein